MSDESARQETPTPAAPAAEPRPSVTAEPRPGVTAEPQAEVSAASATVAAEPRWKTYAPPVVRATSEWALRLIIIAVGVYVLFRIIKEFEEVSVPVALALLGTALLLPFVTWLHRKGVPRWLAVVIALLLCLGVVGGVLAFAVQQFIDGLPQLTDKATTTVNDTRDWLVNGPFHLDAGQLDHLSDDVTHWLQRNQDKLTSGAVATATTLGRVATGGFLMLFLMIFFLHDGHKIWSFVTRLAPTEHRGKIRQAGVHGFHSLVAYVRATVVVAAVDAIGIGIGLVACSVPLAAPLASLVFFGAFIPIVGAFVTGALAVIVALVTKGWVIALIVLAVVVGVMQLEGHVLQPLLLGRSVSLHPVAVILAIAAGGVAWGIVGALLAVPLVAVGNAFVRSLLRKNDPSAQLGAEVVADGPAINTSKSD